MKLSDINPDEIEAVEPAAPTPAMRLSEVNPSDIESTAPSDPGFGPTADHKMRNFKDIDWFGAVKNEFTKPLDPSAKAALGNPFLTTLAGEAAGPLISAAAKPIGSIASKIAERFATSPLPGKIADATNVVGKTKGFAQKILGPAMKEMGPTASKVFDSISGFEGRKLAYSNPLTAIPQAVSDASKAVGGAQKATAWIMDNATKFAPVLQKAAAAGPSALATTSFILQQRDKDYQDLVKKHNEQ